MACGDHGKRISAITHGAVSLLNPIAGTIREQGSWKEDRPGTRKAPALSLDEYGIRCTATFEDLVTPIVRGTKATLTYTLQKLDESGSVTIAIINMRMGFAGFDMPGNPVTPEDYEFAYDSGNTDDLAPITVS